MTFGVKFFALNQRFARGVRQSTNFLVLNSPHFCTKHLSTPHIMNCQNLYKNFQTLARVWYYPTRTKFLLVLTLFNLSYIPNYESFKTMFKLISWHNINESQVMTCHKYRAEYLSIHLTAFLYKTATCNMKLCYNRYL